VLRCCQVEVKAVCKARRGKGGIVTISCGRGDNGVEKPQPLVLQRAVPALFTRRI
jgi:hypothetical protein